MAINRVENQSFLRKGIRLRLKHKVFWKLNHAISPTLNELRICSLKTEYTLFDSKLLMFFWPFFQKFLVLDFY